MMSDLAPTSTACVGSCSTSRLGLRGRPAAEALGHGCYVELTLITVTPGQPLWREEVFGPVLAVTTATGSTWPRPGGSR